MLKILLTVLLAFPALAAAQHPRAPLAPPAPFQDAVTQLKNADPMIRRQGADRLGQLRRPDAIPALMPLLDDSNPFVRVTAVDSLWLLRAQPAAGRLAGLLVNDKDPGVRQ